MRYNESSRQESASEFEDWFDISGLLFRIAKNEEEKQAVYECRAKGYSKYGSDRAEDWIDDYDAYAIQYLCQDEATGQVLGSLRMISSVRGPLEVQAHLDLTLWLREGCTVGEYSRFSVPGYVKNRRNAVKLGLFTLGYRDALRRGHSYQVLWTTTRMRPVYDMMLYQPYPGEPNTFTHGKLGSQEHILMGVDLSCAADLYRSVGHPLYEFMHEREHANIILDGEA